MKVGDAIGIPGYGEFRLTMGTHACVGCVARDDDTLCEALPTSYCTNPQPGVVAWYDLIFLKVEK